MCKANFPETFCNPLNFDIIKMDFGRQFCTKQHKYAYYTTIIWKDVKTKSEKWNHKQIQHGAIENDLKMIIILGQLPISDISQLNYYHHQWEEIVVWFTTKCSKGFVSWVPFAIQKQNNCAVKNCFPMFWQLFLNLVSEEGYS